MNKIYYEHVISGILVISFLVIFFGFIFPPYVQYMTSYYPVVTKTVQNNQIQAVCFSRVEQCDDLIINYISRANKTIYVAMFSFTNNRLADELIKAKNRGVEVIVVLERSQVSSRSYTHINLMLANITVKLDGNPAYMHHKFAVIDGVIVITGSYNWTDSAEDRNDENFIIIADKNIAEKYVREFRRVLGVTR
jgi:phosphatidylserine/phosphatidylglycerophosphate/cardiolipin synthase-like enzyme